MTLEYEELDRIFDLLLLFLSIITAAMFQYVCSIEVLEIQALNPSLTKQELFQQVNKYLLFYLRMYFIPILVLVSLWVFKRLSFGMTLKRKKFLSEFCYAFGLNVLMFNIYIFFAVSFPSLSSMLNPLYLIVLTLQFSITCPFVYYYEKPSISQDMRTRWQKLRFTWWPILKKTYGISWVAWIVNSLIFVVSVLPLQM